MSGAPWDKESTYHGDNIEYEILLGSQRTYEQVPELLRGRTITHVMFEQNPNEWQQGNDLVLKLDDGKVVVISGWGYDAYGTSVYLQKEKE